MTRGGYPAVAAAAVAALAGCVSAGVEQAPVGAVRFDTATAWIHSGSDSTALLVEVAATEAQKEVGLSGRTALEAGSGMWFRFEQLRSPGDGFWMWRTHVPLDVAFLGPNGTILQILRMEPCGEDVAQEDCPGYFPDAAYASALEASAGWFGSRGIGVGDRVIIVAGPPR